MNLSGNDRVNKLLTFLVVIISTILVVVVINLFLGTPIFPKSGFDFEMGLFQALIEIFALTLPLIFVIIELMYNKRMLEIQDLFKDLEFRLRLILFLFATILPVILLHLMTLTYTDIRTVIILDSLHILAVIFLVLFLSRAFNLLRIDAYLEFLNENIEKKLKELVQTQDSDNIANKHNQLLRYLDRLYDAAIVAFEQKDTKLTVRMIIALFEVAFRIEKDWRKYFQENEREQSLLVALNKYDSTDRDPKQTKLKLYYNINWECVFRIRGILLEVYTDPFMRSRLLFDIVKKINQKIAKATENKSDQEVWITIRGYQHCIRYIMKELYRKGLKQDRFLEILGHHIHYIGSYALSRLDKIDKWEIKKRVSLRTPESYKFRLLEEMSPLQEIVLGFIRLLRIFDERFPNIEEITDESLEHAKRVTMQTHYKIDFASAQSFVELRKQLSNSYVDLTGFETEE